MTTTHSMQLGGGLPTMFRVLVERSIGTLSHDELTRLQGLREDASIEAAYLASAIDSLAIATAQPEAARSLGSGTRLTDLLVVLGRTADSVASMLAVADLADEAIEGQASSPGKGWAFKIFPGGAA